MKQMAPSYYPTFRCIADRCRHNCCIGWEIDIDADTAAFYRRVSGDMGKRLSASVRQEDGVASFVLTAQERCPFLNEKGLCDIITALGEQALCQICTDHPRFRHIYSDREEIGLGLCCEEAARLILCAEDASLVVLSEDDDSTIGEDAERAFFEHRDTLFAIARDRSLSISARMQAMLSLVQRPPLSAKDLYDRFWPLERLESDWSDILNGLLQTPHDTKLTAWDHAFEQLLVYFLYRHLPDSLYDGRFCERAAFAVHSVYVLRHLCAVYADTLDDVIDLSRRYSSEIEYSDENIDRLLDGF